MSRPACAFIDLNALSHNLDAVKRFAPKSKILAMVKADAYGHGIVRVAKGLAKADAFGVACLEEAMCLRQAGINKNIVLMEGPLSADEIPLISREKFELVIHHPAQLTMLASNPPATPITVWLKLETGMHRLGLSGEAFRDVHAWCLQHPQWIAKIHFMTHFAQAESLDPHKTQAQIDTFNALTAGLPGQRSLANSAGVIAWPSAHEDWVRPGIMLYGISPIAGKTGADYGLKPVMSLRSRLIAVNDCPAGSSVGYGATWIATEATKIGVVAMGYGDGYPRHIPNGAPVVVNGRILPIVGRISMDMLTVDCANYPQANIGDEVILWGPELPVERVADAAETIAYECVTQVTGRVPMVVI